MHSCTHAHAQTHARTHAQTHTRARTHARYLGNGKTNGHVVLVRLEVLGFGAVEDPRVVLRQDNDARRLLPNVDVELGVVEPVLICQ